MAAKRSMASYSTCNTIKAAMVAKGIYPAYKADDVLYESANDIHLLHGQREDWWFRTANLINNALSFDSVDPNDNALVRAWDVREVYVSASEVEGVQSQGSVKSGSNYTYTIVRNGVTYSSTSQNEATAAVVAFTALVNAL